MIKSILIKVVFQFPKNFAIEPADSVEVSLDCSICKKRYRTVMITKDKNASYCTPTRHQFNAIIKKIDVKTTTKKSFIKRKAITEIIYYINYDYYELTDERNEYIENKSNPMPNWARVNFYLICPKCHYRQKKSTQNNIVRPLQVFCVKCLYLLYEEKTELPLFEVERS